MVNASVSEGGVVSFFTHVVFEPAGTEKPTLVVIEAAKDL